MLRKIYLILLAFMLCLSSAYGQNRRVALIIGNSNYRSRTVTPLQNPVNDARDLSQTLREIGFTVHELTDATREEMQLAVDNFSLDLRGAEAGLFFFAGHGVQVNGRNYLIPVDAELPSSQVVPFRTLVADEVLASMTTAGAGINLFFLDACRDNPLPAESRSLQRGLAVVGVRPPETMIVYATQANATADDGNSRNSPFTEALLRHLPTPGLDIYDLYRSVAVEVQQQTAGRQRPEQFGNVTARYSLASGTLGSSLNTALTTPQTVVPRPTPVASIVTPTVVHGGTQLAIPSSAPVLPKPIEVSKRSLFSQPSSWRYDGREYGLITTFFLSYSEVIDAVKDVPGMPLELKMDLSRYVSELPTYKKQFKRRLGFGSALMLGGILPPLLATMGGADQSGLGVALVISGSMILGGATVGLSAISPQMRINNGHLKLIDDYNKWVAESR